MNSNIVSSLEKSLSVLKLKISTEEVASYMIETDFSDKQMQAVSDVFAEFARRKEEASVNFLLKCSRLAMKNPKTFENFDFSELSGKGVEKLRSITTLAPIYAVSVNSSLNYSTHSPRILKGVISMFQGSSLFQSSAV